MNIQMQIFEIFHLSRGEVVFVGKLNQETPVITRNWKYTATLIVNDLVYLENIDITGERIGGRNPERYRSISTMTKIDLNADFIHSNDCKLILVAV